MKFHCLKHVAFEGPENIEKWARQNGHEFKTSNAWAHEFPKLDQYDILVLMGGPMSANDNFDWLLSEKKIIEDAIENNKKIIGVCLGAQLIANVLGARVYKNREKEIGWFPVVALENKANSNRLPDIFSHEFHAPVDVFHWHGETYDLPAGSSHLLRSEACENQAFCIGDRILALQFHLEGTKESLIDMMENSLSEMVPGRYVQNESHIREKTGILVKPTTDLFYRLLNQFVP